MIEEQARIRLIKQADSVLKASLVSRLQAAQKKDIAQTSFETFTKGPAESIAAGSSEAFAARFRVTAIRQVEVELAKKQVDLQELSLAELRKMNEAHLVDGPRPRGIEGP